MSLLPGTTDSDGLELVSSSSAGRPVTRPWTDVSAKVSASALAGAVTLIVVWTLGRFGISTDSGVESALAVVLAVVAGYVVPDQRSIR